MNVTEPKMPKADQPQARVTHVSRLRHGFFASALLLVNFTLSSAWAQETPDSQQLPWQIGSSSLTGKQASPVIFLSPEQISIPANKPGIVALHFRIADGLHINSHKPHDATLIPTQMIVADSPGLNTTAIDFPAGTDTALDFAPDQKVSLYTGEFVLQAHIAAKPGNHLWQGFMRYQACNNSQCLPPRKVPVAVDILSK